MCALLTKNKTLRTAWSMFFFVPTVRPYDCLCRSIWSVQNGFGRSQSQQRSIKNNVVVFSWAINATGTNKRTFRAVLLFNKLWSSSTSFARVCLTAYDTTGHSVWNMTMLLAINNKMRTRYLIFARSCIAMVFTLTPNGIRRAHLSATCSCQSVLLQMELRHTVCALFGVHCSLSSASEQ